MRGAFDEQLKSLRQEMMAMSGECEEALAKATQAFMSGDRALAASVIESAAAIDRREREIEAMCLKLLLMQHPVASDLRTVSAALKMVTDLERIGNQSADIADIVRAGSFPASVEKQTIHDMAGAVIEMVSGSVDAFASGNTDRAGEILDRDDVVDRYFDRVKDELAVDMQKNGEFSRCAIDLLMIAKYLERSGDHAVNIARWVIYSSTGNIPEEA